MRLYVIAGEASGDLHAANMMKEIKKLEPSVQFRCWGGDLMQAQGGEIIKHYKDLAFMGFTEVLMNIRTIFKNIAFCKADILKQKPDALILVDYPGFNLRIAKFAHEHGIRVFFYISPTVWAWKAERVELINETCEKMFVILPFEKAFYKGRGCDVDFVGHPSLDAVEEERAKFGTKESFISSNKLNDKPIITLMSGSRKQEIKRILPVMLKAVKHFPQYQFVLAGAPGQTAESYQQFMSEVQLPILFGKTSELLNWSHAALVKSGTSTLEAALFNVPEVVCYAGGAISMRLARILVAGRVKYISLVNLIMDDLIVTELIQRDLNEKRMVSELKAITEEGPARKKMLADYAKLRTMLGGVGASERIAELLVKYIRGNAA